MHVRNVPRLSAAAVLAGLVLTAGCTRTDDSPGTPETGDSPVATSSSSTPDPEDTPTSPASSSTPDDTELVDRLLPTNLVPGLNSTWTWQDGETAEASAEPFGICAKADLLSIGATEVIARSYFPPDDSDDNASEQVAEFPDARTARLAWSVLRSWHHDCASKRSANPGLRISRFVSVPVASGTARWYLLSWTPGGEETGRFEALGMVLSGTRIALLGMDNSGQDHDYPPGEEPMIAMVTAAAGLLD